MYIAQVVQLVKMGADAFYFDEFPAAWGGDWCTACRDRFRARYGEEMPTSLAPHPAVKAHRRYPFSTDRRVLQLVCPTESSNSSRRPRTRNPA